MAQKDAVLVSVTEAGRAMGVSRSTIWRLIRRGALPSVRHRGRRLVPKRALVLPAVGRPTDVIPPFDEQHAIFRLVGAGRGGGRTPGARDKHGLLDA